MPGYDRTGPMGKGPMTGGGFGRCGGRRRVGGFGGRGFRAGCGAGRYGRGRSFCPRVRDFRPGDFGGAETDSERHLQDYARRLEDELSLVRRRMAALAETRTDEDCG